MPNTKKQKEKKMNVLTCTIPGLPYVMDLCFPPGKLSVCDKCKKIYKTRKLCRERDGHTSFPWNKTYICFVLDDSCFETDSDGNERVVKDDAYISYKFSAKHIECSPTKYFALFDHQADQLDPICAPCKRKNYTRTHCRVKHKHQNLPWGAVYMRLSAKKITDNSDEDEENAAPVPGTKRKAKSSNDETPKKMKRGNFESLGEESQVMESLTNLYSERNESKAFLMTLWNNSCSLEWLSTEESVIVSDEAETSPTQCKICVTSTEEESRTYEEVADNCTQQQRNDFDRNDNDWIIPQLSSIQSFGSEPSRPPSVKENHFDWHQNHRPPSSISDQNQYHHDGPNQQYHNQGPLPAMNTSNNNFLQYPHPPYPPHAFANPMTNRYQYEYNQYQMQHHQYPPHMQPYRNFQHPQQYQNYPSESEYHRHHYGDPHSVGSYEANEYPALSHGPGTPRHPHNNHYINNTNVVSPAGTSVRSNPRRQDYGNHIGEDKRDGGSSSNKGYQGHHNHHLSF